VCTDVDELGAVQTAASLIDLAVATTPQTHFTPKRPTPKVCFDEWNVWDMAKAVGSEGAEQTYTLSDALAVGVWLNVFVRQSRWLGMCNIAQSVNVISPLTTHEGGVLKQATWWPLLLFSKYVHGSTIAAHVWCAGGGYSGETQPAWLRGVLQPDGASWLDVSASVNEDEGIATLVVVNIHPERDFRTEVRGLNGNVQGYAVDAKALDAVNAVGKEDEVKLVEFSWDSDQRHYTFPKHSFTMLRGKFR
jgi:alpha-L-arabinofuranosidase